MTLARPVRVVHIGTADNSGGAARASFRLHLGLQRLGVDSRMLVGQKVEKDRSEIVCLPPYFTWAQKARRRVVNLFEQKTGLEYLVLPWQRDFLRHPFVREADVVHLHNIHGGFFSPQILPALSRLKPVVWSLHDLWPLTGHCYYPDMSACSRWMTGCGRCPGLRQENHYPLSFDTTRLLWGLKKSLYARSRISFVANSRWTQAQIQASPLTAGHPVSLVPYDLDTEVFRPTDKMAAREALGLPKDKKILFFSAVGLESERKGWRYLQTALLKVSALSQERILLLLAGGGEIDSAVRDKFDVSSLGYVSNDRLLAQAYNAADLFIGASLMETFGQVFLEAMACSTPPVSFDTSGVRDVVRHMETGYLAELKNAEDLARGITLLLDDDALRLRLGRTARAVAVDEYAMGIQAGRIHALYGHVLGQN